MGFFAGLNNTSAGRDLTGKSAADAARQSASVQEQGAIEASQLLDPFQQIGQQGLNQAGFLTDPNAQFDFLQNNPLFQLALDNANQGTLGMAAARGRLSSGDTLQQLSNNTLLAAQPLIGQQKQSIGDLLNFGMTTASNQGNLRTGQAAAQAGGIVGAANARGQGTQNLLNAGLQGLAAFSDPALKQDVKQTGQKNGINTYKWTWNDKANALGLFGKSSGVMADEVKRLMPDAVTMDRGYMKVNYDMIGV